jgi:predicted O-methyltransferase YrrM
MVFIDNKFYKVNNNEYSKVIHNEYNNLKMLKNLDIHERLIGVICKCVEIYKDLEPTKIQNKKVLSRFFSFNTTHGGFIPINLIPHFDNIYIHSTEQHIQNITENNNNFKNNKIQFLFSSNLNEIEDILQTSSNDTYNFYDIIYIETLEYPLSYYLELISSKQYIIIYNENYSKDISESNIFNLSDTTTYIYVCDELTQMFKDCFKYYINTENPQRLFFNNLINLCIMVKNGGPQFEQMLIDNLHIIDKWTILDTGSTDNTINIINNVLVGKKDGNLYQEPFINFKDSRNRLLDLAGNSCKYILMLDDTYVICGKLYEFLKLVRSDQYASSFTLMIHSDDTIYGSNRIIKTNTNLRYIYKIHEVINDKHNLNVVIPDNDAYIEDRRFDYMEERTNNRKKLDLKLLFEEMEDDPNEPRTYYYLAQTYNCLENYEKAFYYFMKRCEFTNAGFIQERVDAAFEAARIANFKLNKSWDICEKLYLDAFKIDESRPESLYFIGIHYYLENNFNKAYNYFKRSFEIGFPLHCQYSLKPTLSYHFLPKFLTRVCYYIEDYILGEKAAEYFLLNNNKTADDYEEIISWYSIFKKLNYYTGPKIPEVTEKPIFCFVADGGFNPWSGSNILTTGVGGSETYIIEMARYIKQNSNFNVYVFCNTPNKSDEIFEGVYYKHLNEYYKFINTYYVKHCIISRFSEYLPLTFKGFTENVYFVIHDLTPSGIIIPKDKKLKQIFCLTEWHVQYFINIFPDLKNITVPFYYGIDNRFKNKTTKIKNKFIYSSFPNRGLLQLLQMWPTIYYKYPDSTLHIYSDVNNKWSNDVEPDKMELIKNLLLQYNYTKNGLGIYYHGWVPKKELAEAWTTSDIWFYPCTFMETFCLTALEAASSCTLCVTNDLAALQNTVGRRGVIIEGDATTNEWKQRALDSLLRIMDKENINEKNQLIEINHEWSKTLSWESQAKHMLEQYIYPNDIIEYKGMYNWTHNLPEGGKEIFLNIISYFKQNYIKCKFKKQISILEIGTYTGTSLIELVKNIPNSLGVGVDMWSNYNENELLSVINNYGVKESFYNNINNYNLADKIYGIQMNSTNALLEFIADNKKFDFIYVDGSHLLLDVYTDMILSWKILEKNGILAVDDYLYKKDDENILNSPYEGINHFLKVFKDKYKILNMSYRLFLEKLE